MTTGAKRQLTLGVPLNGILTFRGRTLPGEDPKLVDRKLLRLGGGAGGAGGCAAAGARRPSGEFTHTLNAI